MNNAEKYIHAVYQEKSFSKAAEKMFVSQPALSSAIKNHEIQLGYKIFNRKTIPLSLTCEGEVYIEYLQEKILLEKQLNYRLHNLDNVGKKTLYIGGTSSTSLIALPKLCKEFCNRFPNINIKIDMDKRRSALLEQLEKGLVDIVVETNADHKKFDSTVLWEEKYMLIVRKDYPGIESLKKYSLSYDEVLSGVYPPEKKITDWDLFKNVEVFKPG